ncbi:MAG: hypothetical protein LBP59_09800 [Planctomycetaceae bacterium]|nr:hypothetical protein [Planctomycetaceae bacterium]
MLGEDTVRRYFCLFKKGGINGLLEIHYEGRRSFLTEEQKKLLRVHQTNCLVATNRKLNSQTTRTIRRMVKMKTLKTFHQIKIKR